MIIIIPRELSLVFAGGARSVVVVKFDMLRVVVMNVKFVTHHLPPRMLLYYIIIKHWHMLYHVSVKDVWRIS